MKLSIADLDDTLKTDDPSRKLVEALDLTRQHIQALSAFEGTIETSVDETKQASFGVAYAAEVNGELGKKENRFQLQLVAAELADGLARIEDRVTTSPEDELLVAHLAEMKQEIDRLELFFDSTDLEHKIDKVEEQEATMPPINLVVEDIDHRINEIETILLQVDDGFVAAAKLAELINQARTFSDHIQDMPIEGVTQQRVLGDKAVEGTARLQLSRPPEVSSPRPSRQSKISSTGEPGSRWWPISSHVWKKKAIMAGTAAPLRFFASSIPSAGSRRRSCRSAPLAKHRA